MVLQVSHSSGRKLSSRRVPSYYCTENQVSAVYSHVMLDGQELDLWVDFYTDPGIQWHRGVVGALSMSGSLGLCLPEMLCEGQVWLKSL